MNSPDCANAPFAFVLNDRTRILVVDDDPIQTEFAAVYLATPTATVDTAATAEDGLRMLAVNAYDVALIDIDLPGMSGIEMVRAMRATPRLKSLPVVMVTGFEDVVSIDQSYDAGATSFVTKPVNWRLLSYHLRFVLRALRRERDAQVEDMKRAPGIVTSLPQAAQRRGARAEGKAAPAAHAPSPVGAAAGRSEA